MSDLQREKFERYCNLWRLPLEINENGFYEEAITHRHWNTWQAATESVVVELPRPSTEVDYGYELNDIQNLLTDAGIKYK